MHTPSSPRGPLRCLRLSWHVYALTYGRRCRRLLLPLSIVTLSASFLLATFVYMLCEVALPVYRTADLLHIVLPIESWPRLPFLWTGLGVVLFVLALQWWRLTRIGLRDLDAVTMAADDLSPYADLAPGADCPGPVGAADGGKPVSRAKGLRRLLLIDLVSFVVSLLLTAPFAWAALKVHWLWAIGIPVVLLVLRAVSNVWRTVSLAWPSLAIGRSWRMAWRLSFGKPMLLQFIYSLFMAPIALILAVLPAMVFAAPVLTITDDLLRGEDTSLPLALPVTGIAVCTILLFIYFFVQSLLSHSLHLYLASLPDPSRPLSPTGEVATDAGASSPSASEAGQ